MKTLISKKWPLYLFVYAVNIVLFLLLLVAAILPEDLITLYIGLFSVIFYRLCIWISPLILTIITWWRVPFTKIAVKYKILWNLIVLLIESIFYLLWYLLSI